MGILVKVPNRVAVELPKGAKVSGPSKDGESQLVELFGTVRQIEGRYVELFNMPNMAAAVLHNPIPVREWEKEPNGFPVANFIVGQNRQRWYSAEQVMLANVFYRRFSNGKCLTVTAKGPFFSALRKFFYQPTLKVDAVLGTVKVNGVVVFDERTLK